MEYEQLILLFKVIEYVLIFMFGIVIGSFLNVCIYRIPLGESIATKNSHCMTCGTPIKKYDLIPLFSWLILRGKCRACKAKISGRYPLVEFLNGALYVLMVMRFPFETYGYKCIPLMLMISALIVIGFMDFDTQEISVAVLIFSGVFAIADYILQLLGLSHGYDITLLSRIIGAAEISLVLLLVGFVITPLVYSLRDEDKKHLKELKAKLENADENRVKELKSEIEALEKEIKENGPVFGFGMGDVLLMISGGFILGWKSTIIAAFIGILLGAIAGMILKRRSGESKFAFGPYLSIGLVCAMFFGDSLFSWYISMMA